jgi:rubrerythrin
MRKEVRPLTATIDFAELDLRGAFDLAIMIEEDAQVRYEELSRLLAGTEGGAAEVFRDMARNEAKHCRELMARRDVMFRKDPRLDTSILDGGEAPRADEAAVAMTARDALQVALEAEIRAYDFYDRAIPHVKDPDVRAFFAELREEEAEHQALLRKKLETVR